MIILLSPAKTLDESPVDAHKPEPTSPTFLKECQQIVRELRKLSVDKLKTVLKDVSAALASLNAKRYKDFDQQESKQCVLAYDGPAYKGLQAITLDNSQLEFAQMHLRILSGLYGMLMPLDAIKPYRLDMGCKVSCEEFKDLYAFWSQKVTVVLNEQLEAQAAAGEEAFIVNVASQEYFKVVDVKSLKYPVYTMSFPGPSVYAKQARGLMARYIIVNSITNVDALKGFTGSAGEYKFDPKQSSEHDFVFVRGAAARSKVMTEKKTSNIGKAAAAKPAVGTKRKSATKEDPKQETEEGVPQNKRVTRSGSQRASAGPAKAR